MHPSGNVDVLKVTRTKHMGLQERWQRTLALWPYIVPLSLVYFAEYSMQVHHIFITTSKFSSADTSWHVL